MGIGINLQAAARYIHATAPAKLSGLYEAVETKCKELKLGPFRAITPDPDTTGEESTHNVRGILSFVESVNADSPGKPDKRWLQQLYATLQARCAAAGYKPPSTAKAEVEAADKKKFDDAVNSEVAKRLEAEKASPPATVVSP